VERGQARLREDGSAEREAREREQVEAKGTWTCRETWGKREKGDRGPKLVTGRKELLIAKNWKGKGAWDLRE